MAIELEFDDFDPKQPSGGGGSRLPKPGKAHFLVTEVEEHSDVDPPWVNVTLEILAHEDESQVGRTSFNSFNFNSPGARDRCWKFACACGVVDEDQFLRDKAAGKSGMVIDWEECAGKTFCGTLVSGEYNGKPNCKVKWDFCHPEKEASIGYPKAVEHLSQDVTTSSTNPPF